MNASLFVKLTMSLLPAVLLGLNTMAMPFSRNIILITRPSVSSVRSVYPTPIHDTLYATNDALSHSVSHTKHHKASSIELDSTSSHIRRLPLRITGFRHQVYSHYFNLDEDAKAPSFLSTESFSSISAPLATPHSSSHSHASSFHPRRHTSTHHSHHTSLHRSHHTSSHHSHHSHRSDYTHSIPHAHRRRFRTQSKLHHAHHQIKF